MKIRAYVLYGVAIALAGALAIAAGDRGTKDDRPSIEANGPDGLRALYLYLHESKRPVSAFTTAPDTLDSKVRTLVVAAPTARAITKEEAASLLGFVKAGGTLVYLSPRAGETALDKALDLEAGERLTGERTTSPDATAQVWQPFGALRGTKTLSVAPELGLEVPAPEAIPVAGQGTRAALWYEPMGKGALWLGAGPDLAANSRIAQGDNLAFWDHLSQLGPMAFDEFHQVPAESLPMSRTTLAFAAQFLLMGLLFAWARGARLGPPRMPPEVRHRASREYLTAFGALLRRAKVEPDLMKEMHQRLRRELRERLGIPLTLSEDEAARAVEAGAGISAQEYRGLIAALATAGTGPGDARTFASLARRVAEVENALAGRSRQGNARSRGRETAPTGQGPQI